MNFINSYLRQFAVGAAVCLLTISTSMSDDIDVYVAPPDSAQAGPTYVVFTLDVRPNVMASEVCTGNECDALFHDVGMADSLEGKTSFFELLVAALKKVLYGLNSNNINIALMIPHARDSNCAGPQSNKKCSNGAYVLSGFKSTGSQTEIDDFFRRLEAIPLKGDEGISGNWSHSYQLKELFFEMYRYITQGYVYNGENGWNNFKTNSTFNINHNDDTLFGESEPEAELMWDTDAVDPSEKRYRNSLSSTDHCSSIFSVNFSMGTANQDGDSDGAIQADPPSGFGITLDNSNFGSRIQVLEYLANTDLHTDLVGSQNIISYFVAKESGGSGDVGGRANDWAQAGGTGSALIATEDPDELVDLLTGLFNEILEVSTTFVAASVPANVFNRAETLNEVFLAIFQPDAAEKPFWEGNVKKLTTTTIEEVISCEDTTGDGLEDSCVTEDRKILVDVLEAGKGEPTSAINPLDGRVRAGALTYWTQTGDNNEYLPAPTTEDEELEFTEGTDGRKVARGGAGQVKPGYLGDGTPGTANPTGNTTMSGPRKLFTEPDGDSADINGPPSDSLVALNADSLDDTVATTLLTDSRIYPGSTLTYGDFLYQTVMDDCSTCTTYGSASNLQKETAQIRVSNLVRFARGLDVDLNTPLSELASKRPWWQADPLHTRPLALNYGARSGYSVERPDIRIFVGGNDGLVQMIRDGRKADESEDGVEGWAFLPREFMPLQKRLLEGTTGIYNPGSPIQEGEDPRTPLHPYAMDGAPTALVIDNNLDGTIDTGDGDQAFLFVGQRRGGKRYYALDISNPDDPKYLWSIGKDDGSDFAEMAQTWSLMRAGVMAVEEGDAVKRRPVLIFTGGYKGDDGGDGDGGLGKDSRVKNHNSGTEILGTDDDEGNALFIVNALTGDLIWKAVDTADGDAAAYHPDVLAYKHPDMNDSVASSPAVLDSNGDGLIDRVYFPDTGGNIWRMDAGDPDTSNWTVAKLFSGGRHFQANNANDRRIMHAPDVVLAEDELGKFDAVIVGSGDRAHPLDTAVENWMYMIKDRNTISGNPPTTALTHADLADLTDNCLQDDADDFTSCNDTSAEGNLINGWKVQLEQCEAGGTDPNCGEKSLASPLTIDGTIFFTTYLPVLQTDSTEEPVTCGPKEGGGLFYALDLQTAGGVLDFNPANNVGGVVSPDRFDRLRSPGIPSEPVGISPDEILRPDLTIQKTAGMRSGKTFWYERRFQ